MDDHIRIVSSIVVLLLLICVTLLFKRIGLLQESDGAVFSKMITNITLPALIFFSMARTEILWEETELALIMFVVSLVCLFLGWVIARTLKLPAERMGPVILTTGFGSSSLLGFALVGEIFPNDDKAMAEAIIISALGVQPLLFTLGAVIAIYYGNLSETAGSRLKTSLKYFYSPIFIAFVAGVLLSVALGRSAHPVYRSIMEGVHIAAAANTFLVTLTVGLFLRFDGMKQILPIGALVAAVKLIVMPVLVWIPTVFMALPLWQIEVLVLEAAMPSAALAVVLASSYGCDAAFTCRVVVVTILPAIATVPIMFELLR